MRTTLNIADNVLAAAKVVASEQGRTVRGVISDLAREGQRNSAHGRVRKGVPLLKVKDPTTRATLEMVNTL